ncbi:MAG: hypothetical protein KDA28_00740, partial [Phycisphaerales bacterium]|nr:hypothetical protein [Phycisphaerales bacterium]
MAVDRTIQVARKAARRGTLAVGVERCGTALAIGAAVFLLIALILTRIDLDVPIWAIASVCFGIALVVGLARTWSARWSTLDGARRLDESNGLHDVLTSAIELEGDDGFTALTRARAATIVPEIDVTLVSSIRPGRSWAIWPLLGAAGVASTFLVPAARLDTTPEGDDDVATMSTALDDVAVDDGERAFLDDMTSGLEGLEDDLRPSAASEALDDRADALEERARQATDADEALRERLDALDDESPLADALREGDYARARDLLRERARDLDAMSEDDRRLFADELDRLADDLGDDPQNADVPEPAERPSL